MASLVNVLDNKSGQKNILINNVREEQFENSCQIIAIIAKIIVKNIDKNVTVTRAYRTGAAVLELAKNRTIMASVLDNQQRFSLVMHAHKLKYTGHKNVYTTE